MIYQNDQSEKQKAERYNLIWEETSVWEKEIDSILAELNRMKRKIRDVDIIPTILEVGFMPCSASEVAEMKKMTEESQLSLLLVINCSLSNKVIEGILQELSWYHGEVVLTAMSQNLPSEDKLKDVRTLLLHYNMNEAAAYLLRSVQDTAKNEKNLPDVSGFFRYSTAYQIGMYEDGNPYGTYLFMRDNRKMKRNIRKMEITPTVALLTVDYSAIGKGDTSEEEIMSILSFIKNQMDQGVLRSCSVEESMDLIVECIKTIQQKQDEYDEYSAKQKEYINELNGKIRTVYEKWN